MHLLVYTILLAVVVLGFINTLWISLVIKEQEKQKAFLKVFFIAQLMSLFVYEVSLIFLKSSVFYLITKDSEMPFWKKILLCILTLMPWVKNY